VDARAAAVADAMAPYAWRDLTERTLARRVVGAVDRYSVLCLLAGVPGAKVGGIGPVDPADIGDARVDHLVRVLEARQWRSFSLDRLCADLIAALADWQAQWDSSAFRPRGTVEDR